MAGGSFIELRNPEHLQPSRRCLRQPDHGLFQPRRRHHQRQAHHLLQLLPADPGGVGRVQPERHAGQRPGLHIAGRRPELGTDRDQQFREVGDRHHEWRTAGIRLCFLGDLDARQPARPGAVRHHELAAGTDRPRNVRGPTRSAAAIRLQHGRRIRRPAAERRRRSRQSYFRLRRHDGQLQQCRARPEQSVRGLLRRRHHRRLRRAGRDGHGRCRRSDCVLRRGNADRGDHPAAGSFRPLSTRVASRHRVRRTARGDQGRCHHPGHVRHQRRPRRGQRPPRRLEPDAGAGTVPHRKQCRFQCRQLRHQHRRGRPRCRHERAGSGRSSESPDAQYQSTRAGRRGHEQRDFHERRLRHPFQW